MKRKIYNGLISVGFSIWTQAPFDFIFNFLKKQKKKRKKKKQFKKKQKKLIGKKTEKNN